MGHVCHVIDKRHHIAGNAFDEINEIGIRVHKYGPHIFHTNDAKVFSYLSKFSEFVDYEHKVKALLTDGRMATLPVNTESAKMVGVENVIDIFFRPYTKKMWGLEIEEIDPEILNRVKIREDDNELYFPNDQFQKMPKYGYSSLISNLLDHKNITISLNTSFDKSMESNYFHVFNSMPIDEYYDLKFGSLPYRSIKFHNFNLPVPKFLPVATVNYTHDGPFTRVTEWKNFPNHGSNKYFTSITIEEPCDFVDNDYERYYPVKDMAGLNRSLYKKYSEIINPKVTFIGRCGLYAYLDMHQAVSSSYKIVHDYLSAMD